MVADDAAVVERGLVVRAAARVVRQAPVVLEAGARGREAAFQGHGDVELGLVVGPRLEGVVPAHGEVGRRPGAAAAAPLGVLLLLLLLPPGGLDQHVRLVAALERAAGLARRRLGPVPALAAPALRPRAGKLWRVSPYRALVLHLPLLVLGRLVSLLGPLLKWRAAEEEEEEEGGEDKRLVRCVETAGCI